MLTSCATNWHANFVLEAVPVLATSSNAPGPSFVIDFDIAPIHRSKRHGSRSIKGTLSNIRFAQNLALASEAPTIP